MLYSFDKCADCIVLSECWKIDDLSLFHLDNYVVVYNSGNINKNDGVVIYFRDDLELVGTKICTLKSTNIKTVQVDYKKYSKNILISGIYRSPSTNAESFIDDLELYFAKTDISESYLNVLAEHNFVSIINDFTRVDGQSKSCIDHIFFRALDIDNYVLKPIIFQHCITDHYTLICKIDIPTNISNRKIGINYIQKLDVQKLVNLLKEEQWISVYEQTSPHMAAESFISLLNNYMKESTVTLGINRKKTKRKKWITTGILNSMDTKNKL
nr:unnamed protein product [Callosobruchus chinensis]